MNAEDFAKLKAAAEEARAALAAGNATQACAIVLVAMVEMTVASEQRYVDDRQAQDATLRGAAPPATKAS